ncbi:metallophosphoesterase [Bradyrhizobium sp. HKCCYLRH1030]|uniref:metallophosphoesterase family protein n=1 Tax=Bradyrhizobium sp. HKCCYLRH1030 TaxID=3420744 RepID=UPI003EBE4B38
MTLFSYIHLSDLHLCQQPLRKNAVSLWGRRWNEVIDTIGEQRKQWGFSSFFLPASFDPEIAKGVAQFCADWRDGVDGIIITGDLATTGLAIDIGVAEQFVKEPAAFAHLTQSRTPTIASLGLPIHLFAGNHDRYVNNGAKPFSNYFDFIFKDYMDLKTSCVGSWTVEKNDRHLAFVHADFSLSMRLGASFPRRAMAYGQGRVYVDVLDELRAETLRLRSDVDGVQIVWLIHFAPYECGSSLQLHDHQRLIDASRALGIKVILCGHTHEALVKTVASQTIYCAGSSCCVDNAGGCMVHVVDFDLDEAIDVTRSTYVWNENQDEFVFLRSD